MPDASPRCFPRPMGTYGYSTMLIIDPGSRRAAFVAGGTTAGVEELTAQLLDREV